MRLSIRQSFPWLPSLLLLLVLLGTARSETPPPAPTPAAAAAPGSTDTSLPAVAVAAPTIDDAAWLDARLTQLASGNAKQVLDAVTQLADTGDPRLFPLLIGLSGQSLYVDPTRTDRHHGLVLIGDEQRNSTQDAIVPLFTILPEKTPILGADGTPVLVLVKPLSEVPSNRVVRARVQTYRTLVELVDGDTRRRTEAAGRLAASHDPENLPLLQRALAQEKDSLVRTAQLSAIAQIQLFDANPATRISAVESLDTLHATEMINLLTERTTPNDKGVYPETEEQVRIAMTRAIAGLTRWQSLMTFAQTCFSGISLGSILVLMALGLAIIYGLMGVINMAHGEFMMIGAYAAFLVQAVCVDYLHMTSLNAIFFLSLPISFLAAGLAGLISEYVIIRRLYSRPLESLLATWGLSLILIQGARLIFGNNRSITAPGMFSGGFTLTSQLTLPYSRLFIIALTVVTVCGVYLLFYRTRFGTRIRAVTQNRNMSACLGIPTRRVNAMAFVLGTGIAGLAGAALTLVGNIVPDMGQNYIVDSFLVVVVGGVGKFIGCVISGMSVGFLAKVIEPFAGAVYGKAIILGLVILFLQRRPTGLFPAKGRYEE